MNYEQFKAEYTRLVNLMFSYAPNQCGSGVYSEQLASLADNYPDFENRLLAEAG